MKLTEKQREVVEGVKGHYVVLAGPGCGKTRTIIEKIAYLFKNHFIPEPYSLLALTFTDSAARVMRSRLRSMGFNEWQRVWVGTFNSFGNYLLLRYGGDVGVKEDFGIVEKDVRLRILQRSIEAHSFDLNAPDELLSIENWKRSGIYPGEGDDRLSDEMQIVYKDYQEELRRMNLIDFGDQVALSVRLLNSSKFVKRAYTRSFKYIDFIFIWSMPAPFQVFPANHSRIESILQQITIVFQGICVENNNRWNR